MITKRIIAAGLLVTVLALAGCETTKGLGKDVENTGKNIKHTVEKND